jgi:hypothetical protein
MTSENTASVDLDDEQDADGERERSTIPFPYADLENSIRIPKAVHQFEGLGCDVDQLAARLNVAVKGGGFRQMLSSAKVFGLVTLTKTSVRLTSLGQRVNDHTQEKNVRAEAFLAVPLYAAIFDRFRGGTLPPPTALENEMVSLGVARKVADRARQVFQRSAQQAGFFAFGQDRLVSPIVVPDEQRRNEPQRGNDGRSRGGSDNGDGGGQSEMIRGLIKKLPADGSQWAVGDRRRWLQAAAACFDLMYEDGPDGGTLKIEIEKGSAK